MATDREKILQTAQKHVDKKRFDKAIEEYQKIIRQDPEDARTLLKIGDLQSRMQAYAEAIATYDRVGQFYAAKGFALKAIAVYKQIRELIRKHAPDLESRYAHIVPKLADIYTQLGLTSDALSAYDEVATRLQKSGRDRDAIDIFRKMVELDMANPLPHLRLAEACCRVQDLDSAIESFWAAAELLLGLERRDDALKVIERILHFRQDPRFARVAAELYLQRNTREAALQAIAKLQISFQADPKDLDTLALLAQAFTVIGDDAKALEVHKEMARIARENGNRDLYDRLLAHLLSVAPDDEGVRALQTVAPPPLEEVEEEVDVIAIPDDAVQSVTGHSEALGSAFPPVAMPGSRPMMASAPEVAVAEAPEYAYQAAAVPDEAASAEHARKAIADAESFRKLRLFPKAIEVLHLALEVEPRSVEIRDKLCQVLQESGDIEGAIDETITLAALYIDLGAPEHGQTLLYEVLQLAPDHPTALQMLEQIAGGAAPDHPLWSEDGVSTAVYEEQEAVIYDQAYGHDAPLPSFALDEPLPGPYPGYAAPSLNDVDDPFAGVAVGPSVAPAAHPYPPPSPPIPDYGDAPLPSFGDMESALSSSAPTDLADDDAATSLVVIPDDLLAGSEDDSFQTTTGVVVEDAGSEVEDILEEADFFAARGLYDDARAILEDQLTRTPNHPLILEHLREIQQVTAKPGESGTIQRGQLTSLARGGGVDEDRAFDIAASLEALDGLEEVAPPSTGSAYGGHGDEVDVEQVFSKFKAGVRAQVAESDASTHYDLGVAYREMGLVGDAITEFELASRDPDRECMCHAMIGMIHLEQGELDKAAASYVRGLEASAKSVDQEMNLYYDLGNVKEMMGNTEEALYYFTKIARRDPGFRDVKDRIAALSSDGDIPRSTAPDAGDDEFDAVFDELFESK